MKRCLNILALFLFVIMFTTYISAFDSFLIVKQNVKSSDAIVIYNIDSSYVKDKGATIIKLKTPEGNFTDLIEYLKQSNIERVTLYSHDDFEYLEFGKLIGEESGVNVDLIFETTGKKISIVSNEEEVVEEEKEDNLIEITPMVNITTPPDINETNPSITGEVTSEKEPKIDRQLLVWLIVGGIILLFIILRSLKKKKTKTKE